MAQTAATAEALNRRSPPTDRGAGAAPGACGVRRPAPSAAQAPNFRPPRAAAVFSARPVRAWAEMPPPASGGERAASPAWLSQFGARAGQGRRVRDSGGSRCLLPPPSPPPPGTTAPPRAAPGPHGGAALGLRPQRLHPEGRPGSARAPRPSPGRWDYFPRPPAPRPVSSRGGTLRAASAAAGYSGSCATYKRSLCGAILSLSVCGSSVSLAPGADSEGRRRRREV